MEFERIDKSDCCGGRKNSGDMSSMACSVAGWHRSAVNGYESALSRAASRCSATERKDLEVTSGHDDARRLDKRNATVQRADSSIELRQHGHSSRRIATKHVRSERMFAERHCEDVASGRLQCFDSVHVRTAEPACSVPLLGSDCTMRQTNVCRQPSSVVPRSSSLSVATACRLAPEPR